MTGNRASLLAVLAAASLAAEDFICNNSSEPQSLDPALNTGVPEARISFALYHDPD